MFGERIRELRQARNITQVELAKMLNVSKQSISNWENENIQPSIDMLVKIASVLSVTCDYILGLDQRQFLEVSGLNAMELSHIQLIVYDIKK